MRIFYQLQLTKARKNGLFDLLASAAAQHALPLSYVLGIASRETSIRNISGDGGHGHGVLQIDDRFHPITRRANFRYQAAIFIDYGCKLMSDNIAWAQQTWPDLSPDQQLKIATSAYNCGRGGATTGHKVGNSDLKTTGHNYAQDVLRRAKIFASLLGETSPRS